MMRRSRFHLRRAAAFWLLFLVGLWFWTPQLWDIFTQTASEGRAGAANAETATDDPGMHSAIAVDSQLVELSIPGTGFGSRDARGRTVWVDPMVRSIEVSAVPREAAAGDAQRPGQTIVLAERIEDPADDHPARTPATRPPSATGLVLSSTLIGVEQRGAYINNRLYLEGATIEHEGETYILSAVRPQSVLLDKAGELLELVVQPAAARTPNGRN